MKPNSYVLTQSQNEHDVGTIVYACAKCDYGCASDDTRHTGRKHISVTLDPDGDYPFFTVQVTHLAPHNQEPMKSYATATAPVQDFNVHYLIVKGGLGSGILKLFKDRDALETYLAEIDVIDMSHGGATLSAKDIENALSVEQILNGDH